jgi:outer membrane biosynthesis protein TonB
MSPAIQTDTPWSRVPWLLPPAIALSLAALVGFDRILGSGFLGPPPPPPVEVSVMELPKPAEAPPPAAAPPAPVTPPPVAAAVTPPPAPPASLRRAASPVPKPEAPPVVPRVVVNPPREAKRPPATKAKPPAAMSERVERLYHVGHDETTMLGASMQGPLRASGSVHLPPLTKAQWAALDKIYEVGKGTGFSPLEVMRGPLRAAASVHLPPLTKAQWAYLDRIYKMGLGGYFDPAQIKEAELRDAAGEPEPSAAPIIEAAITTPMAAIDFSRNPAFVAHNDMVARAVAQPLPVLPPGLWPRSAPIVAVARFAIAADGTATVALHQRNAQPALDRLLLGALERWRFTPAYQNGQAVASTLEVH